MTTIAANREEMAADSKTTWGTVRSETRKISRIRGALVAAAGNVVRGRLFLDWYERGAEPDERPDLSPDRNGNGEFLAMVLDESGLWYYSERLVAVPLEDAWAVGSGQMPALAALRHGMSPKAAVEMALLVDNMSGPPVVVERLAE